MECRLARFIDVDYPQLIESKRDIVLSSSEMSNLIDLPCEVSAGTDPSILIQSPQYVAVGCDLRDISKLNDILNPILALGDALVLCVAEVSITYMNVEAADALIDWAASSSNSK